MKIAVIGGSGFIGSKLVLMVREHGHEAVSASLKSGVNTLTGEGLAHALEGANAVIDVSNSRASDHSVVMNFFTASTTNILAAERAAGVGHHVVLSVVGAERLLESGYMRAKVAQEALVRNSGMPYTIVRATQFFEFIGRIANHATVGNTVRLSTGLMQPILADDVASAIGRIAMEHAINEMVEVAGPDEIPQFELVRAYLHAHSDPREVVADSQARYFGAILSERSLVPGPHARIAETRFEDWLAQFTLNS